MSHWNDPQQLNAMERVDTARFGLAQSETTARGMGVGGGLATALGWQNRSCTVGFFCSSRLLLLLWPPNTVSGGAAGGTHSLTARRVCACVCTPSEGGERVGRYALAAGLRGAAVGPEANLLAGREVLDCPTRQAEGQGRLKADAGRVCSGGGPEGQGGDGLVLVVAEGRAGPDGGDEVEPELRRLEGVVTRTRPAQRPREDDGPGAVGDGVRDEGDGAWEGGPGGVVGHEVLGDRPSPARNYDGVRLVRHQRSVQADPEPNIRRPDQRNGRRRRTQRQPELHPGAADLQELAALDRRAPARAARTGLRAVVGELGRRGLGRAQVG